MRLVITALCMAGVAGIFLGHFLKSLFKIFYGAPNGETWAMLVISGIILLVFLFASIEFALLFKKPPQ